MHFCLTKLTEQSWINIDNDLILISDSFYGLLADIIELFFKYALFTSIVMSQETRNIKNVPLSFPLAEQYR